jgi:hypothetical protein
MQTKNQILADLLKNSLLEINISDSDFDTVRRELEDDQLISELKEIVEGPLAYNPFGVEFLLSDTTNLLQSCLQKRTELKSLEVTLLSDCMNKVVAVKKRQFDQDVAKVELRYPDLVRTLAKQTKLKSTAGSVEPHEDSVKQVSAYESEMKSLKDSFKSITNELEDQLLEFSKDKNSGLNYLSRYSALKEIYWIDVKELFRKLKSLQIGFKSVYNIDTKWPGISSDNLLNSYYKWLKESLLKFNKLLETEQEFTITVSIKHGVPMAGGGNDPIQISSKYTDLSDWGRLLWMAPFSFKFSPYMMGDFGGKYHRIRSIGGTIILSDKGKKQPSSSEDYWSMQVKPPDAKDSDGNIYTMPFFTFTCSNSIPVPNDSQVKSKNYFNIDPYSGWWDVKLSFQGSQGVQFVDGADISGDDPLIADILVFIKVAIIN